MNGGPAQRLPGDHVLRVLREVAILAVVGAIQLGVTTAAGRHQPDATPLSPWGYPLLVAAVLVLPLRHRHPVPTALGVFALTLAYWSAGFPGGPVFAALLVAVVRVVTEGHRRVAFAMMATGYAAFPWLGFLLGRRDAPSVTFLVALAAWLIALGSIAEAVRYRRERAGEIERSRQEAARRQAGEERLRIAREVHDAVAHTMSLITIQAGVALHRGGDLPPQTREALTVIRSASRDALVELRGIVGILREADGAAPRAPTPGLGRLADLVTWAEQVGLDVRFNAGDLPGELPGTVDAAAYRILQEALTNAVRHAGRCRVMVDVVVDDDAVQLSVVDDGDGMLTPSVAPHGGGPGGNGIVGMRERAAAVGGTLSAGPEPGGGWAVRARLPVKGER